MTTVEQRRDIERVRAERLQAERVASAQPVVITGISIPFWRLVWWLVGIAGGMTLIHAVFDFLARAIVSAFAGSDVT